MAPGAENVLKSVQMDHPSIQGNPALAIHPDTKVADLTNEQWASLARAFAKWPFRPDVSAWRASAL